VPRATELELCIVDDASRTLQSARPQALPAAAPHPTARLAENSGIAAASNRALSMATGEFIAFSTRRRAEPMPVRVVKLLNQQAA